MDFGIAEHILMWVVSLVAWIGVAIGISECAWKTSRVIIEAELYAQIAFLFVSFPLLLCILGGLVALAIGDPLDWRWCAWMD